MGYYVKIMETNFRIPADKLDEAYTALCALNHDPNAHKSGGSYSGGGKTEAWFSWMPTNYDETCKTAQAIFEELGFTTFVEDDGALWLTDYDSKIGDEEQFLNAIKHLVPEDAHIDWRGEDGAMWRWTPAGVLNATIIWE